MDSIVKLTNQEQLYVLDKICLDPNVQQKAKALTKGQAKVLQTILAKQASIPTKGGVRRECLVNKKQFASLVKKIRTEKKTPSGFRVRVQQKLEQLFKKLFGRDLTKKSAAKLMQDLKMYRKGGKYLSIAGEFADPTKLNDDRLNKHILYLTSLLPKLSGKAKENVEKRRNAADIEVLSRKLEKEIGKLQKERDSVQGKKRVPIQRAIDVLTASLAAIKAGKLPIEAVIKPSRPAGKAKKTSLLSTTGQPLEFELQTIKKVRSLMELAKIKPEEMSDDELVGYASSLKELLRDAPPKTRKRFDAVVLEVARRGKFPEVLKKERPKAKRLKSIEGTPSKDLQARLKSLGLKNPMRQKILQELGRRGEPVATLRVKMPGKGIPTETNPYGKMNLEALKKEKEKIAVALKENPYFFEPQQKLSQIEERMLEIAEKDAQLPPTREKKGQKAAAPSPQAPKSLWNRLFSS